MMITASEHPISTILKYLKNDEVCKSHPDVRWSIIGNLVRCIKSCCGQAFIAKPSLPHATDSPIRSTNVTVNTLGNTSYIRPPDLHRVPEQLSDLRKGVPYYVGFENGNSDLYPFTTQFNHPGNDYFVTLIGYTGVGKSSVMRALMGEGNYKDTRIPVGNKMNTTRELMITAYEGGNETTTLGVSRQHVEPTLVDGGSCLKDISANYRMLSGCALVIVKDNPLEQLLRDVKDFVNATKFQLIIVYNDMERHLNDAETKFATIKERFKESGLLQDDSFAVKVNADVRYPRTVNIADLKHAIHRVISNPKQAKEIDSTIQKYQQQEKEKEIKKAMENLRSWERFVIVQAVAKDTAVSIAATALSGLHTAVILPSAVIHLPFLIVSKAVNLPSEIWNKYEKHLKRKAENPLNQLSSNKPTSASYNRRIFLIDVPGHGGNIPVL